MKEVKQITVTTYKDRAIYSVVTRDGCMYWLEKDMETGEEVWTKVNTPEV